MAAAELILCALICVAVSVALETCPSPPEIEHGSYYSYPSSWDGEDILVAYYSCSINYELELPSENGMLCKNGSWHGIIPKCIPWDENDKSNDWTYEEEEDETPKWKSTHEKKNCDDDNGGCDHICNKSTNKCECYWGYFLNSTDLTSCEDIDECKESNGGCSHICHNLPGERLCSCEEGYEIDLKDETSCLDIDECADPDMSWECKNGCDNLNGSYKCRPSTVGRVESRDGKWNSADGILCMPGFQLSADGSECQDINECELIDQDPNTGRITPRYCQHKCENTIGSYICHCPEGYHLLEDDQACAWSHADTPPTTIAPSRTVKQCQHGFELSTDGTKCQDIDECKLMDPMNPTKHLLCQQNCRNVEGSFRCYCEKGYILQKNGQTCKLEDCNPGFERSADGVSCRDINECARNSHKCSYKCHNKQGGYSCSCPKGYLLSSDNKNCKDVNESTQRTEGSFLPTTTYSPPLGVQSTPTTKGPFHPTTTYSPPAVIQPTPTTDPTYSPPPYCKILQDPLHGKAYCNSPEPNGFKKNVCFIMCDEGYALTSPSVRTCDHPGIWSGPESICIYKKDLPTWFYKKHILQKWMDTQSTQLSESQEYGHSVSSQTSYSAELKVQNTKVQHTTQKNQKILTRNSYLRQNSTSVNQRKITRIHPTRLKSNVNRNSSLRQNSTSVDKVGIPLY